jgi:hypothetical protein
MNRALLHAFVVLLLFSQACSKKVTPSVTPAPKSIDIEEINFEYMHGKARLHFKDDKKEREVKANIRIRKDSVIWMSFSVVGVQGGKALINKDSITIVSNLEKEYYVFDYKELSQRFNFNVDYAVLQSAMLGNPIIGKTAEDVIGEENNFNLLTQKQGTVEIKNFINKDSQKLERAELIESNSGSSLKINYSDFQPVGDKLFPYKGVIDVFYKTATGIINNAITFEYTKAEVGDRELRFPFNIPKRYDRR